MNTTTKFIPAKKRLVAPSQVLKGGKAVAAGSAPGRKVNKPPVTLIPNLTGVKEKVYLLDVARTAAEAAGLKDIWEKTPIKVRGMLKTLLGFAQPRGGALHPTPIVSVETGKPVVCPNPKCKTDFGGICGDCHEPSVHFNERLYLKHLLTGNNMQLWIEAFDSRYEGLAEFNRSALYNSPVRFYDGPLSSDTKHVYILFDLTELADGTANDKLKGLVTLAADAAAGEEEDIKF